MKRGVQNEKIRHQTNKFIPRLILVLSIAIIVAVCTVITYSVIHKKMHTSNSVSALYDYWKKQDYEKVYEISTNILDKNPLNNSANTFKGYSAFMLAISESEDMSLAQNYLDESINHLRVSLLNSKKSSTPQIEYALGRTYFIKNKTSSYHYYADLAIKYLEKAKLHGYKANDISEFLGLSYASLGETEKSISSFTEALLYRESDTLLFDIARQYYINSQGGAAKQYLYRVVSTTEDVNLLIDSRYLLGMIAIDEENLDEAKKEFEAILEKNENSADAHYGLGVIYERKGESAKARAMWRKALRLNPGHADALKKLSELK